MPTVTTLRRALADKLPDYMPSAFVLLDALNGKIDRMALPAPIRTRPESERAFVVPRTAVGELLAQIWSKVPGIDQVGIYDDFFELGGYSLGAAKILPRISDRFDLELSIRSLFDAPTVADMAKVIGQHQSS